jgi:hypothetical protein
MQAVVDEIEVPSRSSQTTEVDRSCWRIGNGLDLDRAGDA